MIGDILQPTHLLFVLVVALLVLGPKRLPEASRAIGKGIRDFRMAVTGEEPDHGAISIAADACGRHGALRAGRDASAAAQRGDVPGVCGRAGCERTGGGSHRHPGCDRTGGGRHGCLRAGGGTHKPAHRARAAGRVSRPRSGPPAREIRSRDER